jgi:hypothetical protein
MEDIIATATDTAFKVLDRVSDKIIIDCLCVVICEICTGFEEIIWHFS